LLLRIALTVAATWFIFHSLGVQISDLGDLDPDAWRPRAGRLLASCLLLLAGYAVVGLAWGVVVHDMGGPRISKRAAVRIFLLGNLGRYVPGKVWTLAGMAALGHRAGVPVPLAVGAARLAAPLAEAGEPVGTHPRTRSRHAPATVGASSSRAPHDVAVYQRTAHSSRGWTRARRKGVLGTPVPGGDARKRPVRVAVERRRPARACPARPSGGHGSIP
jgi:hypothetical protein